MKISGTYVWTAIVEVEVPDEASDSEQRMALDEAASNLKGSDFGCPILHDCSNEALID